MNKAFGISKNKSFEYQIELGSSADYNPFQFSIKLTSKVDHAGFYFDFGIRKIFLIYLAIYDHRHWDSENDCWQVSEHDKE